MAVDRGAGAAPDPGDPGQAVGVARGRRDGPARRLDLPPPKGRPPSRAAIFCSSSSSAIVASPSSALRREAVPLSPLSRSRSFIAALCRGQGAVSPLAQAGDGDVELAGHGCFQRLGRGRRRVTTARLRRAELRRSGLAPLKGAPASVFWAHVGAPSGLSLWLLSAIGQTLLVAVILWTPWSSSRPAFRSTAVRAVRSPTGSMPNCCCGHSWHGCAESRGCAPWCQSQPEAGQDG